MLKFQKYISKHLLIFSGIIVAIILTNLLLYIIAFQKVVTNNYGINDPTSVIEETSHSLSLQNGSYKLMQTQSNFLREHNIWAMLISSDGKAAWSFDLPDEILINYSLQDIAMLSRGYLHEYPVFVWKYDDDLLVLGYPKSSYTKFTTNYLPANVIRNIPLFIMGLFGLDILILFLAYVISKRSIIKNIMPIVNAVTQLSQGQSVKLTTTGDLSEIGNSLNKTSAILDKKDKARVNWISGVSHDIRTPLSMIMGYADRIATNGELPADTQEQALIIRNQSMKIKGLIQDLNLVSQLEYDMQPLHTEQLSPAKLLRELVADYLNNGLDEKYSIDLIIIEKAQALMMNGDKTLLKRAIGNLVQNSINHNSQGCELSIKLNTSLHKLSITVSDNGHGVSESELSAILKTPHYMNSTDESLNLRHGMGLLLVKQIVAAHHGTIQFHSQPQQGFTASITFNESCSLPGSSIG
ncbi:sensor histidine kinase [Paenibacillus sp. 22594]|uniref:sensor histidine kinase n=1 Tax=Paenibacillus sp. 22594 TaxID=3453947 RepID=UPI003F84ECA5